MDKNHIMPEIEYIDRDSQLEVLCQNINQAEWVALDTEFMREKTYYPKFCLLQIATPTWVVCIDPLAISDMKPVLDALYNPAVLKVIHSCRQDLEIFFHLTGKVPQPLFDTQLAAPLLGYQENPGYGMLVSNMLNINLSKAYTRTDWSHRPLSKEQIKYAADDVIYLTEIYLKMRQSLKELERLDWLNDDFKQLDNHDLYYILPENAWLKIKSKNKLTGKQLSILQTLCKWREEVSQQQNKPRSWLLKDDLLIELAKLQPATVIELGKIRNLHERTIKRYGEKIVSLINFAITQPPIKVKEQEGYVKKTQQDEAIIDGLSAIVKMKAEENGVHPSILASRKELEKLLLKPDDSSVTQGWRHTMAGVELQAFVAGRNYLTMESGQLLLKNKQTAVD